MSSPGASTSTRNQTGIPQQLPLSLLLLRIGIVVFLAP